MSRSHEMRRLLREEIFGYEFTPDASDLKIHNPMAPLFPSRDGLRDLWLLTKLRAGRG